MENGKRLPHISFVHYSGVLIFVIVYFLLNYFSYNDILFFLKLDGIKIAQREKKKKREERKERLYEERKEGKKVVKEWRKQEKNGRKEAGKEREGSMQVKKEGKKGRKEKKRRNVLIIGKNGTRCLHLRNAHILLLIYCQFIRKVVFFFVWRVFVWLTFSFVANVGRQLPAGYVPMSGQHDQIRDENSFHRGAVRNTSSLHNPSDAAKNMPGETVPHQTIVFTSACTRVWWKEVYMHVFVKLFIV